MDVYKAGNGNKTDLTSDDLQSKINKAQKIEWLIKKSKKFEQYDDLQGYLTDLISKDSTANVEKKAGFTESVVQCTKDRKKGLAANEVPEYLTCKITFVLNT